jgi:hypothetical protein
MAWSLFGGRNKKDTPQLEDLTDSGSKQPSNFPLAAKGGDYCRTHSFLDSSEPVWLEAHQTSDTKGLWKVIKVKEQQDLTRANKKIQNRTVEKKNLSLYETLQELAAFEIMRKTIQPYEEVQEDEATVDKGYIYFRKFALYEGIIIDQEGEPHFSPDGVIADGGHFDLSEVLELERVSKLPLLQKRLVKDNYLRDVFQPVASNMNLTHVIASLRTRGHLDELVGNLESAKKCLEDFSKYFDSDYRDQSVDKWLSTVQERQYKQLMPEKFAKYNLSAKTIFESEAFAKLQKKGSAAVLAFANELSELANNEAQDIKMSFHQSIDKSRQLVETLKEDSKQEGVDKDFDTETLNKFITAMEFSFLIFFAKAQLQFVRHLKGNVDEHLETLTSVIEQAEEKFRELGAPEEEVARIRASVLDSTKPGIQPFIHEKIEELKADIEDLSKDDRKKYKQLTFDFKDFKNGPTVHSLSDAEVEELLNDIRKEQTSRLEKEFDLSNLEKLQYLRNKSFPKTSPS